jgi:hypothetical protein
MVMATELLVAVAGAEMVACVGLCTETMVEPPGIPTPLMVRPMSAAVKLTNGEVTVVEPDVVEALNSLPRPFGHGVLAMPSVGPKEVELVTEPPGPVVPCELTVLTPARRNTAGPNDWDSVATVASPPGGVVTSGWGPACCCPPKIVTLPSTPKASPLTTVTSAEDDPARDNIAAARATTVASANLRVPGVLLILSPRIALRRDPAPSFLSLSHRTRRRNNPRPVWFGTLTVRARRAPGRTSP